MGVNKHTHTGAHICTLVCAHTNTYNMSTPSFCSGQWLMQGPITAGSIENKWSGTPIPMMDTCISFAKAWEPYRSIPEGWIDVLWTLSPGYDIATELIKLLYAITCISLWSLPFSHKYRRNLRGSNPPGVSTGNQWLHEERWGILLSDVTHAIVNNPLPILIQLTLIK